MLTSRAVVSIHAKRELLSAFNQRVGAVFC
jgi:hypothetical protein